MGHRTVYLQTGKAEVYLGPKLEQGRLCLSSRPGICLVVQTALHASIVDLNQSAVMGVLPIKPSVGGIALGA